MMNIQMTKIKDLIEILAQEQKTHENLLLAKREERILLASVNAPSLLKNTERISDLVDRARECEKQRIELTLQIAEELGIDKPAITIKDILAVLPPANRIDLERAGQSLKNTLETIQIVNRSNYQLMQSTINMVYEEIKRYAPEKESGVYTARGTRVYSPPQRAGLNVRA